MMYKFLFPRFEGQREYRTMPITNRTPAQAAASAINGSKSHGPVTFEGKAASATNSLKHGLASKHVLLPGEEPEQYLANLEVWNEALRPVSPVEAQLVAGAADLGWRLRRLAEVEHRHVAAHLEARLRESPAGKSVAGAKDAVVGLTELAALSDEQSSNPDASGVVNLLPAISRVVDLALGTPLPLERGRSLVQAYESLRVAAVLGELKDEFKALAVRSRLVVEVIEETLPGLEHELQAERERIAEGVVLGEEKALKPLERRRASLQRELDRQLDLITKVRTVASASGSSERDIQPVKVELKVIGGGRK